LFLIAALLPNGNAHWPIVLQATKDAPDFDSIRGVFFSEGGRLTLGTNRSLTETVVSFRLTLLEFTSFRQETLDAMEAYLQLYPADIRASEYGKSGDVFFNGEIIRSFSLTLNYSQSNSSSFLDPTNYRFAPMRLDFPIPVYGYFSNESVFIPVPIRLIDSVMNVTIRIDPKVLWQIYILSVIVRIVPENISPWWSDNLPLITLLVSSEVAVSAVGILGLRKTMAKGKVLHAD
jgi:hypothetical protein